MLSIGHRVTGSILAPTISIVSIAYITSGTSFAEFVKVLEPLYQNPAVWGSFKFLLAFPFAYHSFNGLRHLVSSLFTVKTWSPIQHPYSTLGVIIGMDTSYWELVKKPLLFVCLFVYSFSSLSSVLGYWQGI